MNNLARRPAGPIADHIDTLRGAGMHAVAISRASGVPVGTIYNIAHGRTRNVYTVTATAILAVGTPVHSPAAGHRLATGSRRRVQALIAIGHPMPRIAELIGSRNRALWLLTSGRNTYITHTLAVAIEAVYDEFSGTPGPATKSVRQAERHGWHDPLAWHDDTIDDPGAEPFVPIHDSIIDEVAIELALEGNDAVSRRLTDAERHEAALVGTSRGLSASRLSTTLHLCDRTIHRIRTKAGVAA